MLSIGTDTITSTPPGAAADQMQGMTAATLVLIALAVVAVLVMIWWGMKLSRRRKEAARELAEEQGTHLAAPEPVVEPQETIAAVPDAAETMPTAEPVAAPEPVAAEAAPASTAADDLTRMKGMGPKLAARLNELGITRFAQIAALSPAAAEALDAEMGAFKGRLFRDRWVEQAAFLARGDTAGYEAAFGKL